MRFEGLHQNLDAWRTRLRQLGERYWPIAVATLIIVPLASDRLTGFANHWIDDNAGGLLGDILISPLLIPMILGGIILVYAYFDRPRIDLAPPNTDEALEWHHFITVYWKRYVTLSIDRINYSGLRDATPSIEVLIGFYNQLPVPIVFTHITDCKFLVHDHILPTPQLERPVVVGATSHANYTFVIQLNGTDIPDRIRTWAKGRASPKWSLHGKWQAKVFGTQRHYNGDQNNQALVWAKEIVIPGISDQG